MKQTYAVLFKPASVVTKGEGSAEYLGEDSEAAPLRLEFHDSLDEQAAARTARSTSVEAMAPVMDTNLVEPYAASSGSGGGEPWGVEAVGATDCGYDGRGVTAAVLDTGIDAEHPCFEGMEIKQEDFTGSGNGDRRGHGTHCAAVFFGRNVDGRRYGVASGITKAFVGKVLRDDGRGSTQMIFDGLKRAVELKADIISMSLGLDFPGRVKQYVDDGMPVDIATSRGLDDFRRTLEVFVAIMKLARAGDGLGQVSLVVAAAGNQSRRQENSSHLVFASVPAVVADISVAAVGRSGGGELSVAPFSNARPTLAAPGMDIASAWLGGEFRALGGTSIACPHAAGVAALWLQFLRDTNRDATKKTLTSHLVARSRMDMLAAGSGPADVGSGLVRAPRALS